MTGNRVVHMLVLLAAALASACGSADVQSPLGPKPVAAVEVTAPFPTLLVGKQMTLVATPRAPSGERLERAVTWSSTDERIATVSSAGVVTAVAPGPVTIVAASESRTGLAPIVVRPVPVFEVRLSVDVEVRLEWNGTVQLSAVPLDAQGNELPARGVQWLSSNSGVASVSPSGVVQAVGAGIGMITAVIDGVPANVGVRVKRAPVDSVVLDLPGGAGGLEVGETVLVGTRVKLASGQLVESGLTWTSSDPAVATASSTAAATATVVAHGAGVVTLTGTSDGKSASLQLRITPKPMHDLIYSRWNAQNASEIFVLPLDVPGAAPVRVNAGNVSRDPSPSPDGTQLVFAVSQIDAAGRDQNDLYVVNRNGLNMHRLTNDPGIEYEPTWSPDGTKILFSATDSSLDAHALWVVNVDGTGLKNLTTALPAGVSVPEHPAWSPDGRRIAFIARRDQQHKVWTMNADGSNAAQLTTDVGFDQSPTWSPDGASIGFTRYNATAPANGWDVAIVSVTGGAAVRLTLPGDQLLPAWSPDGQYIAVTGTVVAGQGTPNLYTLRPDGSGLRLRTVNAAWGGGSAPAWVRR
ncbi:MAG: Ig-like domain-containing protein [Gemmatimonadaceae bacterium]